MNNEEKILALLEQIQVKLEQHDTMFAEQGKQLTEIKTTQAEQGKQLTALDTKVDKIDRRLESVEYIIENRVVPDIKAVAEGHNGLLETLAHRDSVEELKDAMTEWEVATKAAYSEVWNRLAKLEKAK